MVSCRQEENWRNDIAERCAADLTADQVLRAEVEFAFAEQIDKENGIEEDPYEYL